MDEMIVLLTEIRNLLSGIDNKLFNVEFEISALNDKVDDIKGTGVYGSISDVFDKLDEIKGTGLYDSISDVCDKLDSIELSI